MTFADYHNYKDRVLAKTTGGNIHTVGGKLGLILNSIGLCDPSSYRDGEKNPLYIENFPIYSELIEKTISEIYKMTGVWP